MSKVVSAKQNLQTMNMFVFFDNFMLIWPVIILYYIAVGGSATSAATVLATMSMSLAILEVPIGVFSDKYGRALTTQIGAACGVISMSLITASWWWGYWTLLLAVVLEGASYAFYSGNNDALIHDSSEVLKEEYFDNSANFVTYGSYSVGVAMILGGVIASISYPLTAALSVLPRLAGFYFVLKLKDIKASHQESYFTILKRGLSELKNSKSLKLYAIGSTLKGTFDETAWQYRAVFLQTVWPIWAIGFSGAFNNIANGFAAANARRVSSILGGEKKAIINGVMTARGVTIVALWLSNVLSPIIMGLGSIFSGASRVSLGSQKHKNLPDAERATVDSALSVISNLVFSSSILLLGNLFDRYSPANALAILAMLSLLGLPFYYFAFRSKEHSSKL